MAKVVWGSWLSKSLQARLAGAQNFIYLKNFFFFQKFKKNLYKKAQSNIIIYIEKINFSIKIFRNEDRFLNNIL